MGSKTQIVRFETHGQLAPLNIPQIVLIFAMTRYPVPDECPRRWDGRNVRFNRKLFPIRDTETTGTGIQNAIIPQLT
jgi:hypothetical protein